MTLKRSRCDSGVSGPTFSPTETFQGADSLLSQKISIAVQMVVLSFVLRRLPDTTPKPYCGGARDVERGKDGVDCWMRRATLALRWGAWADSAACALTGAVGFKGEAEGVKGAGGGQNKNEVLQRACGCERRWTRRHTPRRMRWHVSCEVSVGDEQRVSGQLREVEVQIEVEVDVLQLEQSFVEDTSRALLVLDEIKAASKCEEGGMDV
ncbi:hypothetical protein C8R47DRAFT_1255913 [Mycena vitilis]|nr:hypothetical protein C8R47DRAFT_1262605 [Mycena vitilis]KAJ6453046.1 hypothetical protein C8R47DRAFT_1255913 [Mycena vitilis]